MSDQHDRFLGTCVAGGSHICGQPTSASRRDFCEEHVDEADCTFGRCYVCRDGHHDACIGVPCRCECPTPDQGAQLGVRERALAKLTPEERSALGLRETEHLR